MTARWSMRGGAAPVIGLALLGLSLLFFFANLQALIPSDEWTSALFGEDLFNLAQLSARDALLPRLVMAWLCGAALGLAGVIFQQVLRNRLAEPGTLGVYAGAKVGLAICLLWMPQALEAGWAPVAFAGGGLTVLAVLWLASRQGFSPVAIILSGLVLSLSLGAIGAALILVHFEELNALYIWDAGSLVQNSWDSVADLLPMVLAFGLAGAILCRPLSLLELEEEGARGLGLSLAMTRFAAISVAVALCASVAGTVGTISFIALAGATIARTAGARQLRHRLVSAPLISAGLVGVTDQGAKLAFGGMEIPAGSVTALLGVPLLFFLLKRLRPMPPAAADIWTAKLTRAGSTGRRMTALLVLLVASLVLALWVGHDANGWQMAMGDNFAALLPWRLSRVMAALGAGFLLAVAGTLLQRLTGNHMASPELLGISSGAALILLGATFFLPELGRPAMMMLCSLCAGLILMAFFRIDSRAALSQEAMLLGGVAIATLLSSFLAILLFLGDPRVLRVLSWLSGSTYSVTGGEAAILLIASLVAVAVLPFFARWLAILPLGPAVPMGIGVAPEKSRMLIGAAVACMTGMATLIVGSLSFVGLMAPHLARMSGMRSALVQTYAAGLIGAIIMVFADWLGRHIAFPWQIPAGLLATGLGGVYFVMLVLRR
ncbi:ABC-type Fe3+-siderophore transport system permease subunit [Phyllobacterium ifriqiyense]|uniref:ABC-type Fe3+-siderophore transport system permease subunit n=1 Tax=Phyllobacterium ifriqiyense TaxID=314238 RepID=A0ABU0S638_9HYPH|nr:Fe(3+)-hydroxamate ABC transporter permease FhuB [Phyllobacterium ifriqiyense]MDQ0996229.1 ABC-type Fe3+-siderophore transport system permease subunit [Phyllobacterium ifriqiyense]